MIDNENQNKIRKKKYPIILKLLIAVELLFILSPRINVVPIVYLYFFMLILGIIFVFSEWFNIENK